MDAERQPELALRLAAVRSTHCAITGQLEESLALREQALHLATEAAGATDWVAFLDASAVRCHTYLGQFTQARRLADGLARAQWSEAVTEVLCPSAISQTALAEGNLEEADGLARRALTAARRLGFERHYWAAQAMRTKAQLALERHDLALAEGQIEEVLAMLSGGRPITDYLAQLDRARIWAAGGHPDEALASLPAARAALRCDHSTLFTQADELEARLRLLLGDRVGAQSITHRLPQDRRSVVRAMTALQGENGREAAMILNDAPPPGDTIRSDLELRLLRASVAIVESAPVARHLVLEALDVIDRHGFVQTVLDTAPRFVDHLISEPARYPPSGNLSALIAAGLEARKRILSTSPPGRLPEPLTEAELRVLAKLPQRLTYADIAYELHISPNTVKTHLSRSYMKLGVTSRSAAVKRAASLGFL